MNTATIRFFTQPLKRITLSRFFGRFFASPADFFLAYTFSMERLREFDRYMQPNYKNDRYCRRLAIREYFSIAL